MPKSTEAPDRLLFEPSDLPQPTRKKKTAAATSPSKRRHQAQAQPPASLQPFLPGLSRRGRPRAKNPIPATVRASESRKRRIAAGMKRIEMLLAPDTLAALERLCLHHHIPRSEIISRLILKAAKRLPPE